MIEDGNGNYTVFAVMRNTELHELFEDNRDAQTAVDKSNELFTRGHRYKVVRLTVKRSTAEPMNRKLQGGTTTHKVLRHSGRIKCMPHRSVTDTYEVPDDADCKRCLL